MAIIICYQLITGVEIVGTIVEEADEYITLENVRKIHTEIDGSGLSVMLLPYATGSVDTVLDFSYDSIVTDYEPDADFITSSNKQIHGSDIATTIGL